MSLLGCAGGSSVNGTVDSTIINTSNTIPANGTILSWCVKVSLSGAANIKLRLKIFRDDGTNFNYVGQSDLETCGDGVNTFYTNIPGVQVGDIVGWYKDPSSAGGNVYADNSGAGYSKGGNIIQSAAKTSWSSGVTYALARMNVQFFLTDVYVKLAGNDANNGSSWGLAKKNVKEGLNTVDSGGILHIGFEDYSAQDGIKFTKTLTLKCETVGSSGGTGTTILPKAAWQAASWGDGNGVLDRSNTLEDTFTETICGLGARYRDIPIYHAKAQRFIPSHRALAKIVLKLQRLLDNDLYVEIRQSNGYAVLGNPMDANGKVASVVVPYSQISTLLASEVTIPFNVDLGNTNPHWIVVCLNAYDPNSTDNNDSYEIAGISSGGSSIESMALKCGNGNWLYSSLYPMLYFKTFRGI